VRTAVGTDGGSAILAISADAPDRLWLCLGAFNAQHIHHGKEAWALAASPQRRLDRAASENAAVGGEVRELDALPVGGEDHGVVAHDAAAPERVKADVAAAPLAGMAVATAGAHLGEV